MIGIFIWVLMSLTSCASNNTKIDMKSYKGDLVSERVLSVHSRVDSYELEIDSLGDLRLKNNNSYVENVEKTYNTIYEFTFTNRATGERKINTHNSERTTVEIEDRLVDNSEYVERQEIEIFIEGKRIEKVATHALGIIPPIRFKHYLIARPEFKQVVDGDIEIMVKIGDQIATIDFPDINNISRYIEPHYNKHLANQESRSYASYLCQASSKSPISYFKCYYEKSPSLQHLEHFASLEQKLEQAIKVNNINTAKLVTEQIQAASNPISPNTLRNIAIYHSKSNKFESALQIADVYSLALEKLTPTSLQTAHLLKTSIEKSQNSYKAKQEALQKAKERNEFLIAKRVNSKEAYKSFLSMFPESEFAADVSLLLSQCKSLRQKTIKRTVKGISATGTSTTPELYGQVNLPAIKNNICQGAITFGLDSLRSRCSDGLISDFKAGKSTFGLFGFTGKSFKCTRELSGTCEIYKAKTTRVNSCDQDEIAEITALNKSTDDFIDSFSTSVKAQIRREQQQEQNLRNKNQAILASLQSMVYSQPSTSSFSNGFTSATEFYDDLLSKNQEIIDNRKKRLAQKKHTTQNSSVPVSTYKNSIQPSNLNAERVISKPTRKEPKQTTKNAFTKTKTRTSKQPTPYEQCLVKWEHNPPWCLLEQVAICKMNEDNFWFCSGPFQYTQSGEKGVHGLKENLRHVGCKTPHDSAIPKPNVRLYLCGTPEKGSGNSIQTIEKLIGISFGSQFLMKRRKYACPNNYQSDKCKVVY